MLLDVDCGHNVTVTSRSHGKLKL